jgi:hypothetical protein
MGAALASCIAAETLWASEGRSEATATRARDAGIVNVGSQEELVAAADVVISVCPPAAALDVAGHVSQLEFDGLYVDVNAVSPGAVRQMGRLFTRFVDGAVIGPPPSSPRANISSGRTERANANESSRTRLYLSGEKADAVAALFTGSPVESRVIGSEPGQASALKMAYAAWTKGTSALLLSVAALATSEKVIDELLDEWEISIPGLRERLEQVSARIGEKAWRFVGEMEEVGRTYDDAGLPDGFHLAAADIYSRLADLKSHPSGQLPDEVSTMLLDSSRDQSTNS